MIFKLEASLRRPSRDLEELLEVLGVGDVLRHGLVGVLLVEKKCSELVTRKVRLPVLLETPRWPTVEPENEVVESMCLPCSANEDPPPLPTTAQSNFLGWLCRLCLIRSEAGRILKTLLFTWPTTCT